MRDLPAFVQGPGLPLRSNSQLRTGTFMCESSPPQSKSPLNSQPDKKPKPARTIKSSASWANTFLPQFGRKGPGSRPLADLRPKSFRTKEEGRGICDHCKGTGLTTCSFCMGLDLYAEDGTIIPCPACGGEKEVTCPVCFGTTKEIELSDKWWEKGIAALFQD